MASQPSVHGELCGMRDPISKNRDGLRHEHLQLLLPVLHMCVHANAEHACVHRSTNVEVTLILHTYQSNAEFPLPFMHPLEETSWFSS